MRAYHSFLKASDAEGLKAFLEKITARNRIPVEAAAPELPAVVVQVSAQH
jgi:hypothetical protein